MLNPAGSLVLRIPTYSLALVSPAWKWVFPFCEGRPCFATLSLWNDKNTNLPRNNEAPVLRLITSEGFNAQVIREDDLQMAVRLLKLFWAFESSVFPSLRPTNEVRDWEAVIGLQCLPGAVRPVGTHVHAAAAIGERNLNRTWSVNSCEWLVPKWNAPWTWKKERIHSLLQYHVDI